MSTKIYNGLRFVPTALEPLHRLLMELRAEFRPAADQASAQFLARIATDRIDKAACLDLFGITEAEISANPLSSAYDELWRRQREVKQTGMRDPAVDFAFSVCILPHKSALYGIAYVEQPTWRERLLARPEIEPFPYWDNGDPPEGISWTAWRKRGRLWDTILDPGNGIPAMAGFNADIVLTDLPLPRAADVVPYVPALAQRAYKVALELGIQRQRHDKPFELTEMSRISREIRHDTEQMRALVAEVEPRLADITVADLLGPDTK